MSDWKETRLGVALHVRHGFAFKGEHFRDEGEFIVLTPGNFHESGGFKHKNGKEKYYDGPIPDGFLLRKGDIVVAMTEQARGLLGSSATVPSDGVYLHNQRLGLLQVSDAECLDLRFCYHLMNTPRVRGQLQATATGSKVRHTAPERIEAVRVRLPPVASQVRIAAVLDTIDDLIENNRRRAEILEEMARLIYREWFVHFRFPGYEDVELVDSALGPIPAGWSVVPFSGLADFVNGFAFKPAHWQDEGLPIVKIKELKNGVTADTPRYHGEDIKERYFVDDGDLLFSWSAHLDAYIWSHGPALLNQHLFVVRPYDLSRLFMFHSLKGRMEDFRARAQGTTMHHIKRSALREVSTVVPDDETRKSFERAVAPMLQLQLNLVAQNRVLREVRDLLLPRLISGELDVAELDLELVEVG